MSGTKLSATKDESVKLDGPIIRVTIASDHERDEEAFYIDGNLVESGTRLYATELVKHIGDANLALCDQIIVCLPNYKDWPDKLVSVLKFKVRSSPKDE
jgi:hypothetical protein